MQSIDSFLFAGVIPYGSPPGNLPCTTSLGCDNLSADRQKRTLRLIDGGELDSI